MQMSTRSKNALCTLSAVILIALVGGSVEEQQAGRRQAGEEIVLSAPPKKDAADRLRYWQQVRHSAEEELVKAFLRAEEEIRQLEKQTPALRPQEEFETENEVFRRRSRHWQQMVDVRRKHIVPALEKLGHLRRMWFVVPAELRLGRYDADAGLLPTHAMLAVCGEKLEWKGNFFLSRKRAAYLKQQWNELVKFAHLTFGITNRPLLLAVGVARSREEAANPDEALALAQAQYCEEFPSRSEINYALRFGIQDGPRMLPSAVARAFWAARMKEVGLIRGRSTCNLWGTLLLRLGKIWQRDVKGTFAWKPAERLVFRGKERDISFQVEPWHWCFFGFPPDERYILIGAPIVEEQWDDFGHLRHREFYLAFGYWNWRTGRFGTVFTGPSFYAESNKPFGISARAPCLQGWGMSDDGTRFFAFVDREREEGEGNEYRRYYEAYDYRLAYPSFSLTPLSAHPALRGVQFYFKNRLIWFDERGKEVMILTTDSEERRGGGHVYSCGLWGFTYLWPEAGGSEDIGLKFDLPFIPPQGISNIQDWAGINWVQPIPFTPPADRWYLAWYFLQRRDSRTGKEYGSVLPVVFQPRKNVCRSIIFPPTRGFYWEKGRMYYFDVDRLLASTYGWAGRQRVTADGAYQLVWRRARDIGAGEKLYVFPLGYAMGRTEAVRVVNLLP